MAIFSNNAMSGTTIIPEPISATMSKKPTVILSLVKPNGGGIILGKPGGISPKKRNNN